MKKIPPSNKIVLTLLSLLLSISGFSQKSKILKGNKEFDKFSYIAAREIYMKLIEEGHESPEVYKNLGNTYYWNSDYSNAAKWYSKSIETFPSETEAKYYYRTAQSLKSLNQQEESDKIMELYLAKESSTTQIENFKNNEDYLKYINLLGIDFEVNKVDGNTSFSAFGPSFYGDKIVFASSTPTSKSKDNSKWDNQPYLDLFVADIDSINGKLSNLQKLSGEINTAYHESSTSFSKDGKTVYFTRNNYFKKRKGRDEKSIMRLKLYKATLNKQNIWGDIQELPFNSDNYSVAHPALSVDEKRLYFSSDMPGTLGMSDLWYVDIMSDNNYGTPINLGKGINTKERESFPFLSADDHLYFSTDGRSGEGGYDVYVTQLNPSGMPTEIYALEKPINSSFDDIGFIIKENKKIGYLSSNRDGGKGSIDDDIYCITRKKEIHLLATVFDLNTKELLQGAAVQLMEEPNVVIGEGLSDSNGAIIFKINYDKHYAISANKDSYKGYETKFNTDNASEDVLLNLPLELYSDCAPNDLGCRLGLQPIYFDLDKHHIRPDAAIELNKILSTLLEHPELIIQIESHTDSRASHAYNLSLSDRRAKSTLEWLVSKGIDRNRLSANGFGETQLVNDCKDDVSSKLPNKCSEEEHQLNRRSMFIIED